MQRTSTVLNFSFGSTGLRLGVAQGGHKVGEKEFPEFYRDIIILFQRLSQHSNQLLLVWITRACRPMLLKSTDFVHQIHLAAYGLFDTGCIHNVKSVFPEVAQNSLRIPGVFHVQRNPSVHQVFHVCGHPGVVVQLREPQPRIAVDN